MMGVNYDLFWTLNPKSLSPFIKAFSLKHEFDYEYDDRMAWLSGLYIRMAIASTLDKDSKYPEKPLSETMKVVDKKVDENKMMNKIKQAMLERMAIVNQGFKKEVM